MHEELREWDKPLLEMFLKKLDELNPEKVKRKLEKKGGITLCSGRSYDWVIWLNASIDKEGGCVNIDLWKGAETDGISDEMLERISTVTTNIKEVLEIAKDMLKRLIEEKLPETPTHYLEEE